MADTGKRKLIIDDRGDFLLVAAANGLTAPVEIDEIRRIPVAGSETAADELREMAGLRRGNYAFADVGIQPEGTFVRPFSLDAPGRARQPGFVEKTLKEEFSIEPESTLTAVVHPVSGNLYDPTATPSKLLLFAGADEEAIRQRQIEFGRMGVFSTRLQITPLASLGCLVRRIQELADESPELAVQFGEDLTHAWVLTKEGVQSYRQIRRGFADMYPVVQRELGLRDTESARRMLAARTFDLENIGSLLVNDIVSEFLTMIGFYEVQYGQTIDRMSPIGTHPGFSWVPRAVGMGLGMDVVNWDVRRTFSQMGVGLSDSVDLGEDPFVHLDLLALVATHKVEA